MLAHARAFLVCNLTILTVVSLGASHFPPPPGWQWITDSDARLVSSLDSSAAFFVNGEKVAEVPRSGALFDGVVGLRVGPQLNLHVTNLDLTHRLALPRASK